MENLRRSRTLASGNTFIRLLISSTRVVKDKNTFVSRLYKIEHRNIVNRRKRIRIYPTTLKNIVKDSLKKGVNNYNPSLPLGRKKEEKKIPASSRTAAI